VKVVEPLLLPSELNALRHRAAGVHLTPEAAALRSRHVYQEAQRESPQLREANFRTIGIADLELLFQLYDRRFFEGDLARLLKSSGSPLSFRLSRRLTHSAGTTTRLQARGAQPPGAPPALYEIAVSTPLLYQTFTDVHRPVLVNGLVCRDRLEALQRVFEHELLHLLELLIWGRSSCKGANFRALAWKVFAHTQTHHDLVTQDERARRRFDVGVGDRVAFTFEGVRHLGVVNRITRRATVLVEGPTGGLYRDGRRYHKFYVPLVLLEKCG
jgi:hypothetical protein